MSIFVLSEFHELQPPMMDGGLDTEWCACDSDDAGMYYLLNKDRYLLCNLALLDDVEIDKNLHFPSEVNCHMAAYEYYVRHGKQYPYIHQWRDAIVAEGGTQPAADVQSQIMEFK